MEQICFVELSDVVYFFEEEMRYAGTSGWIRDNFELEACIEAPKHTFGGEYLLDIYGMASKYIASFAIRHPFTDGNKRVGAVCAVVFLEANGHDFKERYEEEMAEVIYSYLRNEIKEEGLRDYFAERCVTTG